MDIETPRLILRLVPLTGLAATAAKDHEQARRILGDRLPEEWFEETWVTELRLKQWKENPDYGPWSIRAIALKETGQFIGKINCHHVPMPFVLRGETRLATELGYRIFDPWRRQGYGIEAVRGFMTWGSAQGLEAIILSISPENQASLALAKRLRAEKIGSQIDDIDGPEDIYYAGIANMNGG